MTLLYFSTLIFQGLGSWAQIVGDHFGGFRVKFFLATSFHLASNVGSRWGTNDQKNEESKGQLENELASGVR